jgi:uncharacterized protein (DUF433 family)
MAEHARIEINPKVMMGKPVIRGTRITVEHILRMQGAGWSADELVYEHPRLTREDVRAANEYAADHLRDRFMAVRDAAE